MSCTEETIFSDARSLTRAVTIGISGGHLSPAVTAAVAMTKKGGKDFGPMEAMLYMAAQFSGEIMSPPHKARDSWKLQ